MQLCIWLQCFLNPRSRLTLSETWFWTKKNANTSFPHFTFMWMQLNSRNKPSTIIFQKEKKKVMLCGTCYLSPKLSLEAYAYCEARSLISCVPYLPVCCAVVHNSCFALLPYRHYSRYKYCMTCSAALTQPLSVWVQKLSISEAHISSRFHILSELRMQFFPSQSVLLPIFTACPLGAAEVWDLYQVLARPMLPYLKSWICSHLNWAKGNMNDMRTALLSN